MRLLLTLIDFLTIFCFRLAVGQYEEPDYVYSAKIVGGSDVAPHEFKSIVRYDFLGCSGTLIAPNWVVTAAHCVYDKHPGGYLVAGDHNKHVQEKGEQRVQIKNIIVHENYKNPDTHSNDIALLEINPPAKITDTVDTALLPMENYTAWGYATVVGWGRLSDGGISPETPKKVSLPIIPTAECKKKLGAHGYILYEPGSLCTLFPDGSKDACQGDSGGPLYTEDDDLPGGKRLVLGAVSWGVGCARNDYPGVFVDFSYFIPWIEKKVGKGVLEFYSAQDEYDMEYDFTDTHSLHEYT